MRNLKQVRYFLLIGFMLQSVCRLSAQEVLYPDYEVLKDSATNWMMDFYSKNNCININTVRKNLLGNMNLENKVYGVKSLPSKRKKVLDGKQLYSLCRNSSLSFFTMEFRPQTNDYLAYPIASAVALSEEGICVTNFHVLSNVILSGALNYSWTNDFMRFVMDSDGKVYPVKEILTADPINDFVIFRVDVASDKLTPMPLGEPLEVGEEVYCLSHPQGNLFYLTKGIVSRNVSMVNKENGQVKLEMQISADYGVGSSGGPIIDSHGNLVGIVSSTYSLYANPQTYQNFQMAIKKTVPVKLIKECFPELKK
jgi:serine protease Do